jgi:hypothetical protein
MRHSEFRDLFDVLTIIKSGYNSNLPSLSSLPPTKTIPLRGVLEIPNEHGLVCACSPLHRANMPSCCRATV